MLVQGVGSDELALGFLPFAYYEQNKDKLKLVPVDDGKAKRTATARSPEPETIRNGTYQPLSRPLFIYVSKKAAERPGGPAVRRVLSSKRRDAGPRGRLRPSS